MRFRLRRLGHSLLAAAALGMLWGSACADPRSATTIPAADLLQPAALAAVLRSASAPHPVILQVGFRTLYDQAHIPAAQYAGPAGEGAGLKRLRSRAAALKLAKNADIVLYCGCCPWDHCPNVADAYFALRDLGFTQVKVLYLPDNFGDDWVAKGYPVSPGS